MKNILKKEITKADTEINRDQTIIKEYKQVNDYNNMQYLQRLIVVIDIIMNIYYITHYFSILL